MIRSLFFGWVVFVIAAEAGNAAEECVTEYYPAAWGGARISNMWTGELCPNKPTPEEACLQVYECGGYSVVEAWKSSYIWGLMYHTDPAGNRYVTCDLVPYTMPPVRDCGTAYCYLPGQIGVKKTLPCPPPTPPDQPITYSIRLSNDAGPVSGNQLVEVEPGVAVTTLRAQVFNNNNQNITDAAVELTVDVAPNSGGHRHDDHRNTTQMGRLESPQGITTQNGKVLTGATDANGLAFTFTAPPASGDHTIKAKCADRNCNQEGPNQQWVGHKYLAPLSAYEDYVLIGESGFHPSNHHLTTTAVYRISLLASLWNQTLTSVFPEYVFLLHLNDASLERGGIFDIGVNWRSPHFEHCQGAAIDVRANDAPGAIPAGLRNLFEKLARTIGADPHWDVPKDDTGKRRWELRHYHVRLLEAEGLQCP